MNERPTIVADTLRVHGTLYPDELHGLVVHWTNLDHLLQSFEARSIALDLYVNDRDTPAQRVTLEAHIGGFPPFVAKASGGDLDGLLNRVRDELIRQLRDAKTRNEPRHNRNLRASRSQ
jgi:hypothetical protein